MATIRMRKRTTTLTNVAELLHVITLNLQFQGDGQQRFRSRVGSPANLNKTVTFSIQEREKQQKSQNQTQKPKANKEKPAHPSEQQAPPAPKFDGKVTTEEDCTELNDGMYKKILYVKTFNGKTITAKST